jgi:hypothetical protein
MSGDPSGASLPLAVAVVVPKDGDDALEQYADGTSVGEPARVTPRRSTATKVCAAVTVLGVVAAVAGFLFFGPAGSTNATPSPAASPLTTSPAASPPTTSPTVLPSASPTQAPFPTCEGDLEQFLSTLDSSSTINLNCDGVQGAISTELGRFTMLTSLRCVATYPESDDATSTSRAKNAQTSECTFVHF